MKTKKKFLSMLLSGLLVTSLVLPGVAAAGQGKGNSNQQKGNNQKKAKVEFKVKRELSDINEHWAKKNIERLNFEGVIKGYSNGTFQPNKPVKMAEVVTMVVNALGLSEEVQANMDAELPFYNANSVPSWATGFVKVALDKGLIDSDKFQANKAASRMAVTTILVKALGEEPGDNAVKADLNFTDIEELDENSNEYLTSAVLNNLIKGYEDNTFRPNKPVTRAEMATLLSLLEDKQGNCFQNGRVNGFVDSVDATNLKIAISTTTTVNETVYEGVYDEGNNIVEYQVLEGAAVYRNNQPVTLNDVTAGDRAILLLNSDDQVVYIDAKEVNEEEESTIKGLVTDINIDDMKLEILQYGVAKVSYPMAEDVKVTIEGETVSLTDIHTGDLVKIELNDNKEINKITLKAQNKNIKKKSDGLKVEIEGSNFEVKMVRRVKGDEIIANVKIEYEEEVAENEEEVEVEIIDEEENKEEAEVEIDIEEEEEEEENENEIKIKMTGDEANQFIDEFIAGTNLEGNFDMELILNKVEEMLGTTIDRDDVKIEVKIQDGENKIEYEQE